MVSRKKKIKKSNISYRPPVYLNDLIEIECSSLNLTKQSFLDLLVKTYFKDAVEQVEDLIRRDGYSNDGFEEIIRSIKGIS
jgi:hypothetical protein